MTTDIIIVGAGIAGSTLASLVAPHASVALVDRDVAGLPGSTGHAPGFVGQLNTLPTLTELAGRSIKQYASIPNGFANVGGLEVHPEGGERAMHERVALANRNNIAALLLPPQAAAVVAPAFVKEATVSGGVFFPTDGTANARAIAHHGQATAKAAGATLLDADVTAITKTESGYTVTTSTGELTAKHVVLCTGIWAGTLAPSLAHACVSVSHPYVYSAPHETPRQRPSPFVRFPAQSAYVRDHGKRDGLGSYNHDPLHVLASATAEMKTAFGEWEPSFKSPIDATIALLPRETAAGFKYPPYATPAPSEVAGVWDGEDAFGFNGLFSVTPDGLPLIGRLEGDGAEAGLWAGVGVWVTHAGGAAGVLADSILAALGTKEVVAADEGLRAAIDPKRFDGSDKEASVKEALGRYNNIYNKKTDE